MKQEGSKDSSPFVPRYGLNWTLSLAKYQPSCPMGQSDLQLWLILTSKLYCI